MTLAAKAFKDHVERVNQSERAQRTTFSPTDTVGDRVGLHEASQAEAKSRQVSGNDSGAQLPPRLLSPFSLPPRPNSRALSHLAGSWDAPDPHFFMKHH